LRRRESLTGITERPQRRLRRHVGLLTTPPPLTISDSEKTEGFVFIRSHGELRNPAIATELAAVLGGRSPMALFALLRRFSGLPGPRFNDKLAWAVGQALSDEEARAEELVKELCAMNFQRAPPGTDSEFLPIVGAFCLGARLAKGRSVDRTLERLRVLAEDSRHLVREGVCRAIVEASGSQGEQLVRLLATWMDGYLSASVALEALTVRRWLDALKSPEEALARLDEAFLLVESAPRAARRSQGYRTLVKTLSEGPAKLMDRFRDRTLAWIESKTGTSDVELREALEHLVRAAWARGHAAGKLEDVERMLAASAPPRRDPKTYVGPTRKRGSRRR